MMGGTPVYEPQSTVRLHFLARALYACALIIFGRLIFLQVFKHDELHALALQQQEKTIDLHEMRGSILDVNGRTLAISVPMESVCVNPKRVPDPEAAAALLAGALKLDEQELRMRLSTAKKEGRGFLWIKRRLSKEEAATIHMLRDKRKQKYGNEGAGFEWIEMRTESKREYPNGELAAAVLGWVNHRDVGMGGLEQTLDKELQSQRGSARVLKDARPFQGVGAFEAIVAQEAVPGKNITISIDSRIQYAAEVSLARAAERTGAPTGAVVVMDPRTGSILAMASYPSFNPNEVPEDRNRWMNRAISAPYEPGSVYKTITFSSAFEFTNLQPADVINCGNGSISLYGHTIRDTHSYPALAAEDVYAHSSNVGTINISRTVGEQNLYEMIRRFEFGQKTGIPLPGEEPGRVQALDHWKKITQASVSIGYGVTVTTLQLARAGAVIANGGMLVKPRLVVSMQRPGGPVEKVPVAEPVRIMKPDTAIQMRRLMERVVLLGTGKKAFLKTHTSGGKTGSSKTVEVIPVEHQNADGSVSIVKKVAYTHNTYNGTFLGLAPLVDPSVVIAVTLNGTHGTAGFGGEAAAPVFKDVALAALRLREIPQDKPSAVPVPGGDSNDLVIAQLSSSGTAQGDDFLFASVPSPQAVSASQTAAAGGLRSFSKSEDDEDPDQPSSQSQSRQQQTQVAAGPVVPNFQGKTLRAVLEAASGMGLDIEPQGHGVARSQSPAPGERIAPGQKVKVLFAR